METRVRYKRLQQVFERALEQTVARLEKRERISACFPQYASTVEGISHLENCQRQLVEFWVRYCRKEFTEILQERHVEEKLDELDDLVVIAQRKLEDRKREVLLTKTRSKVPIESQKSLEELTSQELLDAHLLAAKKQSVKELDTRIDKVKKLNEGLIAQIKTLEEQIEMEQATIDKILDENLGTKGVSNHDETLVQGLQDMVLELKENVI
ncbi:Kinetochore-associated protein NNF1 [Nakaseomyces bracarensis]|uniref:Kinetochore-associated protein n=1 Tax=Nakaseomyces bracarensis TaxID=273131 RepID=A0ABR4NQ75_9SACH